MERILFEEIKPFVRRVKKVKTEEIKAGFDMCSYANIFIYVLRGRLCVNAGGEECELQKGGALVVRPGVCYTYVKSEMCEAIITEFDMTSFSSDMSYRTYCVPADEFTAKRIINDVVITNNTFFERVVYSDMISEKEKVLEMLSEYGKKARFSEMKLRALMIILLSELARRAESRIIGGTDEYYRIREILEYIDEHFTEKLTNKSVGKTFSMHENYISDLIKNRTGLSLHRYILSKRIAVYEPSGRNKSVSFRDSGRMRFRRC